MMLIDLIVDVLYNSTKPLVQSEINKLVDNHQDVNLCSEYLKVKVRGSAIARCLTKNTTGTNPMVGIIEEGKASYKRYYLLNKQYSFPVLSEYALHPILVKFAYERFGIYSKTIQAHST